MLRQQAQGEPSELRCRAGRCSFWVDWQGNLGNCGMNTMFKHSLKEQSFQSAWDQIVEQTNALRYSSVCTNCPNYWLCHACAAMVANECGSLDGRPEYLCRMSELSAKYYQEYAKLLPELPSEGEEVQIKSHMCDL